MAGQFQYDSLPVVETKAGKLRGYQWKGTYIFKGIRYARAKWFQLPEEAERTCADCRISGEKTATGLRTRTV